jgi:hemerythrin-like metal-binding protein
MGWAQQCLDNCSNVDIAELDAQHQQLFRLLDRLEEHTGLGPNHPTTVAAVATLVAYANNHFFVEESLMRMLAYAGYEAHVADHNRLREELDEFRLGAFNESVAGELLELFRIRFNDHIEMMDRQYTSHFLATSIHAQTAWQSV